MIKHAPLMLLLSIPSLLFFLVQPSPIEAFFEASEAQPLLGTINVWVTEGYATADLQEANAVMTALV